MFVVSLARNAVIEHQKFKTFWGRTSRLPMFFTKQLRAGVVSEPKE
jgi:hypothetical protein